MKFLKLNNNSIGSSVNGTGDGTIEVTADAWEGREARSSSIKVTGSKTGYQDKEHTISVTQQGQNINTIYGYLLESNPNQLVNNLIIPTEGGKIGIVFRSNATSLTVDNLNNCSLSTDTTIFAGYAVQGQITSLSPYTTLGEFGKTGAYKVLVVIEVAANTDTSARTISFTLGGVTISLTQSGVSGISMNISTSANTIGYAGGNITITINNLNPSDVTWTAEEIES